MFITSRASLKNKKQSKGYAFNEMAQEQDRKLTNDELTITFLDMVWVLHLDLIRCTIGVEMNLLILPAVKNTGIIHETTTSPLKEILSGNA